MNRRSLLLWSLSVLMLGWLMLMTWQGRRFDACAADGGRWDVQHWRCDRDIGRIILERGMKRL